MSIPQRLGARIPNLGLVLSLALEENVGNVVNDLSGKGNNGTIVQASWDLGQVGNALSFDGVDDRISVPDSTSIRVVSPLTLELWLKTTQTGNRVIIEKDTNNFSFQRDTDNKPVLNMGGGGSGGKLKGAGTFHDGLLHHLVFILGDNYYPLGSPTTTITGNPTDRHAFCPCHKTRIQEVNKVVDGTSRKYLAYDSNAAGTQIRLYHCDDLDGAWTQYSGNPILTSGSAIYRWPSVVYEAGTFHMFLTDILNLNLERWTSSDGITFTFAENVIAGTGDTTKNPFIWFNPNDSKWYLYWHDGANIKVRSASSLTTLVAAGDTVIATQVGSFGAPSVMYRDGYYWLTAEFFSTAWNEQVYRSKSPDSGFILIGTILTNDEACTIQLLHPTDDSKAYIFVTQNATWWYQQTRRLGSEIVAPTHVLLDGAESLEEGKCAVAPTYTAASLFIGSRDGVYAYGGVLDEIHLYERALTKNEAERLRETPRIGYLNPENYFYGIWTSATTGGSLDKTPLDKTPLDKVNMDK